VVEAYFRTLRYFFTFVEELSLHIVMGWMEHMILNGSVISYNWYGRVIEFAEL
jgi:hypothetical protein